MFCYTRLRRGTAQPGFTADDRVYLRRHQCKHLDTADQFSRSITPVTRTSAFWSPVPRSCVVMAAADMAQSHGFG